MGQNKFEKELREKMNQREIMPSDHAWDRLDAMLTVAEEARPKRQYNWLFIAATILGFLLLGAVLVWQTEEATDKGRVDFAIEGQTIKQADSAQPKNVLPQVQQSQIASLPEAQAQHQNESSTNQSSIKKRTAVHTPEKRIASLGNPSAQDQFITDRQSNPIIARTEAEPAAGNQKAVQATTDKVDALLAAVAPSPEVKPKTSVKVNAKSLLSEVDQEVNLSFRKKMLRRAGEVAEAVAHRNNE